MNPSDYRFEQLAKQHNRLEFSCGIPALDRYLHQQAAQDVRRHVAAVYVLVDSTCDCIVGYHCLSAFTIQLRELPDALARRFPPYEALPAILLGRLAVDSRYRGYRFGELLLVDALHRVIDLSERLGTIAVVVDAKDDSARTFYERYEFIRVVDSERRLFLPTSSIVELLR